MDNISTHITYEEATHSATGSLKGLDNTPPAKVLANMQATAEKVFEPLRAHFDKPIHIISFYRSPAVNRAVGGAATSQHMTGEAMDLQHTEGFTNADMFYYIRNHMDFDQLIWEFGTDDEPSWVHVSWSRHRRRKSVLKAKKVNGRTVYTKA